MKTQIKWIFFAALMAFSHEVVVPTTAQAGWVRHGREIVWTHGRWIHDRHEGRLGWWWVVGPAWHYYERPHSFIQSRTVIIQQAPIAAAPVVITQPQPVVVSNVSPVLYYCASTGTNYPETMNCPGGWSTVTAEMPPQP